MNNNLKNAFSNSRYEPEENLTNNIWQKILSRNRRIKSFKIGLFSSIGAISLFGLIPVLKSLASAFAQSGSYEYLSLAFSGNGEISLYWKELLMSIAESLPTINIIYALTLILIMFISIKYIMKQFTNNKLSINSMSALSF
jgi:hypothetical protein